MGSSYDFFPEVIEEIWVRASIELLPCKVLHLNIEAFVEGQRFLRDDGDTGQRAESHHAVFEVHPLNVQICDGVLVEGVLEA